MKRKEKHESPIVLRKIPAVTLVFPIGIKRITNGEKVIVQTGPDEVGEVQEPSKKEQDSPKVQIPSATKTMGAFTHPRTKAK